MTFILEFYICILWAVENIADMGIMLSMTLYFNLIPYMLIFFSRNIRMYLQFLSFIHIVMTQVGGILV